MALLPNATQFEGTGESPPKDIVIGFDFGTSCTKVVVQDHFHREAWAVPFPEFTGADNRYLLPTQVWLEDGALLLAPPSRPGPITDL